METAFMSNLPVSLLDLMVIGIVLISGLLASVRGFAREVLAIGSWVAAAIAAYALHPRLLTYLEPHIANRQIAIAAAIAIVFLCVLVIATIITVKISDLILDSSIGTLDRTLGFLFGAARGFLIAAIAFLFFDKLVGEKQYPDWIKDAKTRPILKETGDQIIALLPSDPGFLDRLKAKAAGADAANSVSSDPTAPPKSQ
jgi:membrane protein required for colicin V production